MPNFDREAKIKDFLESCMEIQRKSIQVLEESIERYKNSIKTCKHYLRQYPFDPYYKKWLEIDEQALAHEQESLKKSKDTLAKWLEDYKNYYGKKESLKLRINNLGLKIVKGGEN